MAAVHVVGVTVFVVAHALACSQPEVPRDMGAPDTRADKPGVFGVVVDPQGKPLPKVDVFYSFRGLGRSGFGRVLARSVTDSEGRFRIEWPAELGPRPGQRGDAVWAYQPGSLLASQPIPDCDPTESFESRLVINPPARTIYEIRTPEGVPLAGVHVKPRVTLRDYLVIPDGLAELIEAATVTDANGRAVLTALHAEELNTVFATAKGFGTQQFAAGLTDVELGPRLITLFPVGRVKGKLVGPVDAVKRQKLLVATRSTEPGQVGSPGVVFCTTDDEGRFDVPEIATGKLRVTLDAEFHWPWYLPIEMKTSIPAGKTTDVELTLKPLLPVTGVVREKETGNPVTGIPVNSLHSRTGRGFTTDLEGRFHGYLQVGRESLGIGPIPAEYALDDRTMGNVTVTDKEPVFEVPPFELLRAGTLRGVVKDDQNQPVAGATVGYAAYVEQGKRRARPITEFVRADSRGRFSIPHIPLGVKVELTASHRGLTTPAAVIGRLPDDQEVVVRVSSARAARLAGRVIDSKGAPIAGASIRIRRAQRRTPGGPVAEEVLVDLSGAAVLITGKDGRFETPKFLDKDDEYSAFATNEGYKTARTAWTLGSSGTFRELVLESEPRPGELKEQ